MPFLEEAALQQSSQAIHLSEGDGRAADVLSRGRAESRLTDLTEPVFGLLRPRGSLGWGYNQPEDQCCWALGVGDVVQYKPLVLVKRASPPFQAQWSSRLKVHVKVIWACSGALASGKVSAHLCGYSVQWMAGCRSNMDAAAASVLLPHGRLGWGHNLDEE